jgi:DnaJ-class molecular chaperone
MEVKAECGSCSGTGLYRGFAEPQGTAVVCHTCRGTGCQTITYKPFERRQRKQGIQRVLCDGGMWFARNGNEKTISVDEFYSRT